MTRSPRNPLRRQVLALVFVTGLVLAGCSSGDSGDDATATTDSVTATTVAGSSTTAASGSDGGAVTASTELCLALNDQLNAQSEIIDNTVPGSVESLANTAREANDALGDTAAGNDQAEFLVDATNSLLDELEAADFDATAVIDELQTTLTDPDYLAALQSLSQACAAE